MSNWWRTKRRGRRRRRPLCGSSTWPVRLVAAAVVILVTSNGNSSVGGSLVDTSYSRGRRAQEIDGGGNGPLDEPRRRTRRLREVGSRAERQEEIARLRQARKGEKQKKKRFKRMKGAEQEDGDESDSARDEDVADEDNESGQSTLQPPNADGLPEIEEEDRPAVSFAAAFAAKAQKPKVGRLGSPSPTSAPGPGEVTAEDAIAIGGDNTVAVDDEALAEDSATGGKSSKKSKMPKKSKSSQKSKRPSAGSKSSKDSKKPKSAKSKSAKKSKAAEPTGAPTTSMSPTGQQCGYTGYDPEDVKDGCPGGQFCRLDQGTCRLKIIPWRGTCVPIPDECDDVDEPVCGCDAVTYTNLCVAHGEPQNVAYGGKCVTVEPTVEPSYEPTTYEPTNTSGPTHRPTSSPTTKPSSSPTNLSTGKPTVTPTHSPSSRPVDFNAPLIRMTIPAGLLLSNFVDTEPNREVLASTISEVASSGLGTGQRVEGVDIVGVNGMDERIDGATLAKKLKKLKKMNTRGANDFQEDRLKKKRKQRKKKTDDNGSLAFGRRSLQTDFTTIAYELVLVELCGDVSCTDLEMTTTLYDEVTTNINSTIETGEFTAQLQTNAEECGEDCEGLSAATVEQGGFEEEEIVIKTGAPTLEPSEGPSPAVTIATNPPSGDPSVSPTNAPSSSPTTSPSVSSSSSLSASPSVSPSVSPTNSPSSSPTASPSVSSSSSPSASPSVSPSVSSTNSPTKSPLSDPTITPTATPSISSSPSFEGSAPPSVSSGPSGAPTLTKHPSLEPTTGINGGVASVINPETAFESVGCIYTGPQMGDANIRDGVATDFNCPVNLPGSASGPPELIFTQDFESLVLGMRVYANTEPFNGAAIAADPVSYTIEGRSDETSDWKVISFGEFDETWAKGGIQFPPPDRNVKDEAINSSFEEGDPTKSFGYVSFSNTIPYRDYRVRFPFARFNRANYTRIAISELELPGLVTLEPAPSSEPTLSAVPTASLLPTPEIVDGTASVIDPATELQTSGCIYTGPSIGDAYLRDGLISDYSCPYNPFNGTFPPQLILIQEYDSQVLGIRVYANSEPLNTAALEADPISYTIEGRINENSDWVVVSEGDFDQAWSDGGISTPPPPRNTENEEINSSFEQGDPSKSFGYASFENNAVYRDYRVTFPLKRFDINSTAQDYGRFAISELELPGVFVTQAPPTSQPVPIETNSPTNSPATHNPSLSPTISLVPSEFPSEVLTLNPNTDPTAFPTGMPSLTPTLGPSEPNPTESPTSAAPTLPAPSQSPIASCTPENACDNAEGSIGIGSCVHDFACQNKTGNVGDLSCIGEESCKSSIGSIGDNSCLVEDGTNGDSPSRSCMNNAGSIGSGSCIGIEACVGNTGTVAGGACIGYRACYLNSADISKGACIGENACLQDDDDADLVRVGSSSCMGDRACADCSGSIDSSACLGDEACNGNKADISTGACNGLYSCLANEALVSDSSCISDEKTIDDVDNPFNYAGVCQQNSGLILSNSCIGLESCSFNSGPIGSGSCIGTQACCSNDQTVEAGQCDTDQECSKCPPSNLLNQKIETSSTSPTNDPSYTPTTSIPTFYPTVWYTYTPTMMPSFSPTISPSVTPSTRQPSSSPTIANSTAPLSSFNSTTQGNISAQDKVNQTYTTKPMANPIPAENRFSFSPVVTNPATYLQSSSPTMPILPSFSPTISPMAEISKSRPTGKLLNDGITIEPTQKAT